MAIGDFIKKATEKASELGFSSNEKIVAMLDDYRRAISSLEAFGFRVGKLRVIAGVLPEVSTTIVGSVDYIQPDRLRHLMESNPDRKMLNAILSALLTATNIRETVELNSLKCVVIDVILGLPPKISVELTSTPPSLQTGTPALAA